MSRFLKVAGALTLRAPADLLLALSGSLSALHASISPGAAIGGYAGDEGATLRGALVPIALAGVALVLNEAVGRRIDPPGAGPRHA